MLRIIVVAVLCLWVSAAQAAGRVALVIGNAAYENATPLLNPVNDAAAIASALEGMGFTVLVGTDLDKTGMERKLRDYAAALRTAEMALFYYSGHGLQVNGTNYLVPIDARLEDESSLAFEMINADQVFGLMGGNDRLALAFLDACRDNPLARSLARSLGKTRSTAVGNGLAAPNTTGTGLFIGFSTSPNDVALDGSGSLSPFTEAVLEHIATPGLEINQLMTRVKASVRTATRGDQRPWTNSDLSTDVYLVPAKAIDPVPELIAMPPDEAHWQIIASSEVAAVFEEFVRRYPGSVRRAEAESRIASLTTPKRVPVDPVVTPAREADCGDDERVDSRVIGFAFCLNRSVWTESAGAGQQEHVFAEASGQFWLYVIPEVTVYASADYREGILAFLLQSTGQRYEDLEIQAERTEVINGRNWDMLQFVTRLNGTPVYIRNYRISEAALGSVQLVFVGVTPLRDEQEQEVQRLISTVSYGRLDASPRVVANPDEIWWRELQGTSDTAALRRFLAKFPQSARRVEAETRIASLTGPTSTNSVDCDPSDVVASRVISVSFCLEQGKWTPSQVVAPQEFAYISNDQTMIFTVIPELAVCPPQACRSNIMANIATVVPNHQLSGERVETYNGRKWDVIEFQANVQGNDMSFFWYRMIEPGFGMMQVNFATYTAWTSSTVPVMHDVMEGISLPR